MNLKMLFKFISLFLLFPSIVLAQDITGLWKGEMYVDSTKKTLPYEISISDVNGKLVGYSLITFEEAGKQEMGTRDIVIERREDKIIIVDVSLIDNSFTFIPPKNIKKTMELILSTKDDLMILTGSWSTNRTKRFLAASGTVKLQRNTDFKKTGLYKKLNTLGLADKLVFKETMPNPVHDIIKIDSNNTVKFPPKLFNPDEPKVLPANDSSKKAVTAIFLPKMEKKSVSSTILSAKIIPKLSADTIAKPILPFVKPLPVKPLSAKIIVKKNTVNTSTPVKNAAIVPDKSASKTPLLKQVSNKNLYPVAIQKPMEIKKQAPAIAIEPTITKPAVIEVPRVVDIIVPGVIVGAADINQRSIASTQSVFFQSDSLVLTLYDNGYVDGDTVSVVMNGNVIFSKQGLSTKPVSKTIYINQNTPDSIMLVMYAENLGSIPPNTGLLVVHDGEAIYDVRFSADLSSNAAIILRRKKILK